jgi:hypothetical protein
MAATGTPAGVGELTVLLTSWRLHLEAANLSARTIQAYTDDGALFARSLADKGMPTAADSIRGEHVEALDDQGSWRGGGASRPASAPATPYVLARLAGQRRFRG